MNEINGVNVSRDVLKKFMAERLRTYLELGGTTVKTGKLGAKKKQKLYSLEEVIRFVNLSIDEMFRMIEKVRAVQRPRKKKA